MFANKMNLQELMAEVVAVAVATSQAIRNIQTPQRRPPKPIIVVHSQVVLGKLVAPTGFEVSHCRPGRSVPLLKSP
jgi:hypothetical protein